MIVALARLALLIPHSRSLKDKRAVLRKITDRVRSRFHVAIAEVDGQDTWQRAVIGLAVVGSDAQVIGGVADDVIRFIEAMDLGQTVSVERELVHMGDQDLRSGGRLG